MEEGKKEPENMRQTVSIFSINLLNVSEVLMIKLFHLQGSY